MSDMFLTRDEVATLTGRKIKSKQIEELRRMRLTFWVNADDRPVVPRSAIEGRKPDPKPEVKQWVMPK